MKEWQIVNHLIDFLRTQNYARLNTDDTPIVETEFCRIGMHHRLDLVALDSQVWHGFEVKSKTDTIKYLFKDGRSRKAQIPGYLKICDYVTIVLEGNIKRANKVIEQCPDEFVGFIGVILFDGEKDFTVIKKSRNHKYLNEQEVIKLLWGQENYLISKARAGKKLKHIREKTGVMRTVSSTSLLDGKKIVKRVWIPRCYDFIDMDELPLNDNDFLQARNMLHFRYKAKLAFKNKTETKFQEFFICRMHEFGRSAEYL